MIDLSSTNETLETILSDNSTVILDFWAEWCGPCKNLSPVLEKFQNENPNIKVVKINVDKQMSLANQFQVSSLPTLVLFKEGQEVKRKSGSLINLKDFVS